MTSSGETSRRINLKDLGREPFRIFFPEGVLAGILGVALWPLYFGGLTTFYPGQLHPRIMVYGMFGGFMVGFLGTAMPRLLSAPALGARNVLLLVSLHLVMVLSFATQHVLLGDGLFLVLIGLFGVMMARRARHRKDLPPPGFVLVGLAFVCAVMGAIIALFQPWNEETATRWVALHWLLTYQGFVLLPILGIGPFLLPRFFGLASPQEFGDDLNLSAAWKRKAALALAAGLLIVGSFLIETAGWFRVAYAVRFGVTLVYLLLEFPMHRAPKASNVLGASLRLAFGALLSGFILTALFPAFQMSLMHLTLVGGFAVILFTVATRVVFGHSGHLEKLKTGNRWMLVAVALMLLGMATRISGDFWPKIMASHYRYGALLWIGGVLLWSFYVLPKVREAEIE